MSVTSPGMIAMSLHPETLADCEGVVWDVSVIWAS